MKPKYYIIICFICLCVMCLRSLVLKSSSSSSSIEESKKHSISLPASPNGVEKVKILRNLCRDPEVHCSISVDWYSET